MHSKKKTQNIHSKVRQADKKGRVILMSNGSSVLGRGDIGPEAVAPLLESRARAIYSSVGVDVVPLAIHARGTEELVYLSKTIAPACSVVLLENMSASESFETVAQLQTTSSIPVLDSYQFGIATVLLAGLINAHKVSRKNISTSRIAILGTGPISIAIAKLLLRYGVGDIIVVDRDGILNSLRTNLAGAKEFLAKETNKEERVGGLLEAVIGADAVISVSKSGPLKGECVRMMAQKPIVFALRDPEPELSPKEAHEAGAYVYATGSDAFPNQLSDMLVLPYLLKGIISKNCKNLKPDTPLLLADALASLVSNPSAKKILPTVADRRLSKRIGDVL